MGKNPAFQFYPSDWTRDLDDYPLEIEGAWIRICCRLWWSETPGCLTKTLKEWSRILRKTEKKTKEILHFLIEKHISGGHNLDNQNITINSKRMIEDDRIRKIRQEVGKLGGNPQLKRIKKDLVNQTDNQKPTPSSSSSSSSSSSKKKESISHSEVKKFLTHYGERFEFHFGTKPQIEWGKDGSITKNLLKTISFKELQNLLEAFFISEDKFILKSGYTIGVFKSQINKLKIGEPLDGMDLWLKMKEKQDARKRQKAILVIDEKVESDIPDKS